MAFDLYLYVAFAAGLATGRFVTAPEPWTGRVTFATIVGLVVLLGATLAAESAIALVDTLPVALVFAAVVLGATAGVALLLRHRVPAAPGAPGPSVTPDRIPIPMVLLVALLSGFGLGHLVSLPYGPALRVTLCLLLAVVGFGLRVSLPALRRAWAPIAASVIGGIGAAALVGGLLRIPWSAAFSTSLAFGWYTLAGPLVTERWGPSLGLLAFLTNYLREDLTMLLAPVLGRRLKGEGIAALGGATSMDTTLYFCVRYGDPESGSLALASGLALTIGASLLLPALLAL